MPDDKYCQLAYQKYEHANSHMLQYIVDSGIVNPAVLDVGCWMGAFGEQLMRHIDCQVDGVDINREVIDVAKSKGYRHVYAIDLNSTDFSEIIDRYDFIVFGDVLEHTINPDYVIDCFKSKLTEKGLFAVSLPNVGFIVYRLLHLLGKWDYKEYGVMDKTHLRFFTLKSMKRFFESHELHVLRMNAHVGLNRSAWIIKTAKLLADIYPALFAIQMVFLLDPVMGLRGRCGSTDAL